MLQNFERIVRKFSNWFANAGAVFLLVILIMTFSDILGTKFLNSPIPGSVELTGLLQAMLIPLAVALTQIHRQHIKVEIFTARLPKPVIAIIDSIVSMVLFCVFIVLIWQTVRLGISLQSVGEYSITLHLPINYFVYVTALAFIPICFVLLLDFTHALRGVRR